MIFSALNGGRATSMRPEPLTLQPGSFAVAVETTHTVPVLLLLEVLANIMQLTLQLRIDLCCGLQINHYLRSPSYEVCLLVWCGQSAEVSAFSYARVSLFWDVLII